MNKIISFEKEAARDLLDYFDKAVDKNGYLVEKANSKQKILDSNREKIHIDNFAGIVKEEGKIIFFKTDIFSLMRLSSILK